MSFVWRKKFSSRFSVVRENFFAFPTIFRGKKSPTAALPSPTAAKKSPTKPHRGPKKNPTRDPKKAPPAVITDCAQPEVDLTPSGAAPMTLRPLVSIEHTALPPWMCEQARLSSSSSLSGGNNDGEPSLSWCRSAPLLALVPRRRPLMSETYALVPLAASAVSA